MDNFLRNGSRHPIEDTKKSYIINKQNKIPKNKKSILVEKI